MDAKQTAIQLFNETWDLIDLKGRTPEQDILMLHKAHTSCYLWSQVGEPVNVARGEWQVSRVYAVLRQGVLALKHGEYSLNVCKGNGIGGLDLTFGYEAVARAFSLLGDAEKMQEHKALGIKACGDIPEEADRNYALGEIESIR